MQFDYTLLKRKIKGEVGTQVQMAEAMQMSLMTMNSRLCGRLPFTQPEIVRMCEILHIPKSKIPLYFFTIKVS